MKAKVKFLSHRMHFQHKIIGFIIFSVLVLRVANGISDDTDVTDDYGDYNDEISYEEKNDYSTLEETPLEKPDKRDFKPIINEILTSQQDSSSQTTTTKAIEVLCPIECDCNENFINCSNKNLTQIPKNLPNYVHEIDLSNNNISQLDNTSSLANLPKLYKINLANNQIEDIEQKAFRHVEKLKIIDLTNNSLTQIHPETFKDASGLEQLWLSGNPIEMPNIGPFLDQKGLKLLDLENCNLTNSDLQADLFKPLVVLKSLNLMNNFFEGNINTKTFEPLENLNTFRVPEISKKSINELCAYLKAIDVIEVAGKYKISCYELAAGLTFEESILQTSTFSSVKLSYEDADPGTNEVISEDEETEGQQKDTPVHEKTSEPNMTEIQNKVISTRENGMQEHHVDPDKVANESNIEVKTDKKTFGEKFNLADIPQEIINQILIGLILVIIVALVISIIFRRDCCGIKTKLCRTRRPRTSDQVRPIPEEVPLNKITTSS